MAAPSSRRPADVLVWLATEPRIELLIEQFPDEWARVRREAAEQGASSDEALRTYILGALAPPRHSRGHSRTMEQKMLAEVRRRMLLELLRQADLSAETGVETGRVRFNRLDGTIAQWLLFEHDLVRKPVSMTAYRLAWPLLRQRRLLLPLVRRRGIYCFYSRSFVRRLAKLVRETASGPVLEVAAGDGTLARFLQTEGVDVRATDDYSWAQHIAFDDTVERLDAVKALRTYEPTVVVCSWPPPANSFERAVFASTSVQLYVVVLSRTRANAGAWDVYDSQTQFDMVRDSRLSRLVLPSGSSEVVVFRRRQPPTS